MAQSGVRGEGFHTVTSPQMAAMKAFQAHTATGKLKAEITPTMPKGMPLLVHAMAHALGMHGAAVEHARLAHREVGDVDHLLHFTVALRLDLAHLQGHQAAQGVLVLAQLLTHEAHGFATLRRRHFAPELVGGLRNP